MPRPPLPPVTRALRSRPFYALLGALLVTVVAVAAVLDLSRQAADARGAERELSEARLDLFRMQDVPWGAAPGDGDPAVVERELEAMAASVDGRIAGLRDLPGQEAIARPLARSEAALRGILDAVSRGEDPAELSEVAAVQAYAADAAIARAERAYRARATDAVARERYGTAAIVALLFVAFALFFARAVRARRTAEVLASANRRLAAASREEALTDALTGLRNRRALMADLEALPAGGATRRLGLFDLDGFKLYNDRFGHPAGDVLLARLGERLAAAVAPSGTAYRMGGDEFCVVVEGGVEILDRAAAALTASGGGFEIGCSYGWAPIGGDVAETLHTADQRMYARKSSGRASAGRQSADVLLTLVAERSSDLERHTNDVADRAEGVARRLGLPPADVERIRLAAQLHDVGKAAVPDAILDKPGPLDDAEWEFIRRHPLMADRILRAAPALSDVADLVRGHHERVDGSGYPDGLKGGEIPVGARIIAAADAFDAMVSTRPYRPAMEIGDAVAELRRCAGTQFDPRVVEALVAHVFPPAATGSGSDACQAAYAR